MAMVGRSVVAVGGADSGEKPTGAFERAGQPASAVSTRLADALASHRRPRALVELRRAAAATGATDDDDDGHLRSPPDPTHLLTARPGTDSRTLHAWPHVSPPCGRGSARAGRGILRRRCGSLAPSGHVTPLARHGADARPPVLPPENCTPPRWVSAAKLILTLRALTRPYGPLSFVRLYQGESRARARPDPTQLEFVLGDADSDARHRTRSDSKCVGVSRQLSGFVNKASRSGFDIRGAPCRPRRGHSSETCAPRP